MPKWARQHREFPKNPNTQTGGATDECRQPAPERYKGEDYRKHLSQGPRTQRNPTDEEFYRGRVTRGG